MIYFLVFNLSLQETDFLEIVLLRDVRTGKSAKVPKVCVDVISQYSVYFVARLVGIMLISNLPVHFSTYDYEPLVDTTDLHCSLNQSRQELQFIC